MHPMTSLIQFQSAVDTEFVLAADPTFALRLVSVQVRAAPDGYEQFSLRFEAPASRALEQATYTFSHATLGADDVFIVPIAQTNGVRVYEACFFRTVA